MTERLAALLASERGDAIAFVVSLGSLVLLAANAGRMLGGVATRQPLIDPLLSIITLLNLALLLLARIHLRGLRSELAASNTAAAHARHLATRDSVTHLLNRRGFEATGARFLIGCQEAGLPMKIIAIDLDGFKAVNDTHGHAAGDTLLADVGAAIAALLPRHAVSARLGGDEFVCIVALDTDPARVLAGALVSALDGLGDAKAGISASIGIATTTGERSTGLSGLLKKADDALYAAKQAGGNRAVAYGDATHTERARRAAEIIDMRAGLGRGEFAPFYEQQIDLETGALTGFEVLARWNHPTRGLLPPAEFLPLAEASGLIGTLSTLIMRAAFDEANLWDEALTLTVNVSPAQFRDPWFAQKLLRLLAETGFPPHRLEIDIPEAALEDNLPLARSLTDSLHNEGVRLAFDNFGTGQSRLAHIRALRFDRIKLDRSVVERMVHDRDSAAIVQAVATLAESMHLQVVVGGIADAATQERISRLGFRRGQGFHLGRPMTLDAARLLLAERGMLTPGTEPAIRSERLAG